MQECFSLAPMFSVSLKNIFCLATFSFRTFIILTLTFEPTVFIELNEWEKFEFFFFNVWVIVYSLLKGALSPAWLFGYRCQCSVGHCVQTCFWTHYLTALNSVFFAVLVATCNFMENYEITTREQLFQLCSYSRHFIWDCLHLNKTVKSSCQCCQSILLAYFSLESINSVGVHGNGGMNNLLRSLVHELDWNHHLFGTSSILSQQYVTIFQYTEQLLILICLFVDIVGFLVWSLLKLAVTIVVSQRNDETCNRHWQRVLPQIWCTFCSAASQISDQHDVLGLFQEE